MEISGWWLSPTPLKNMSSSVGMMKFPVYGKIKNVPNHTNQIYLYPSVDDFPTYSSVYRGFSILWMDKPAAPVGKYW